MKEDSYKETRELNFPGMIARVHIPDITPTERQRRLSQIHNAAAELLKGGSQNEH